MAISNGEKHIVLNKIEKQLNDLFLECENDKDLQNLISEATIKILDANLYVAELIEKRQKEWREKIDI